MTVPPQNFQADSVHGGVGTDCHPLQSIWQIPGLNILLMAISPTYEHVNKLPVGSGYPQIAGRSWNQYESLEGFSSLFTDILYQHHVAIPRPACNCQAVAFCVYGERRNLEFFESC